MKLVIDNYLRDWKQRPDRKALLLRGARQVGKTYAIRTLGESYNEFVEINLEMNPEYAQVFHLNLDPHRILRELRLMTGKRLVPGSSLLFIDLHSYAIYAIPHVLRQQIPRDGYL